QPRATAPFPSALARVAHETDRCFSPPHSSAPPFSGTALKRAVSAYGSAVRSAELGETEQLSDRTHCRGTRPIGSSGGLCPCCRLSQWLEPYPGGRCLSRGTGAYAVVIA